MKIYFVADRNEITYCALFRNKKDAQRYIKETETYDAEQRDNWNHEGACLELNVIEFEPNKNGIIDAMRDVFSASGNCIQDYWR
tara:strand:+ start:123 stop:374 length:252 start_codon:yes stop_codon:yes gene_type:complete